MNFFRLGLILASLVLCASEEDVASPEIDEELDEEEDEQPPYDIPTPDAFFYETFSSPLEDLDWVVSEHNEGTFKIGRGTQTTGIKSEQGLVLEDEAKRYSISSKFTSDFDPQDQDLVIQYEVRFHKNHECGGAYLKVLKSDPDFEPAKFKDGTEYIIMFGPDKCGTTDKVHFIFKHEHKITGELEEKHLKNPPTIKNDRLSHLYTLVIRTDNTYEIFIDQASVSKGKLLEDFEPPVNPPKEIDDPEDHKPEDWVDEAKINDPEASKPDDWDENAPKEIIDEDASQPTGWNVDEPFQIPDPQAEQPEDWDEEDDGEWEAPLVDNPACSVGCGEWEAPLIPNPDYKGKWIHPKIDNPDYKGEWAPKKIDNPNYFEDPEPHQLNSMGGAGFEIWTMQNQIEFDNVFIDNSLDAAIEFGKATWAKKYEVEKAAQDKADGTDASFMSAVNSAMTAIGLYSFMDWAEQNPVYGVGAIALALMLVSLLIFLMVKLCCGESDDPIYEHSQGHVRREVSDENKGKEAENDDDDDDDDDEEGEPEGTEDTNNEKNETAEEVEEGVDKVKEKQELEKAKLEKKQEKEQVKEQKKQKPKLKKKKSRSRKAD